MNKPKKQTNMNNRFQERKEQAAPQTVQKKDQLIPKGDGVLLLDVRQVKKQTWMNWKTNKHERNTNMIHKWMSEKQTWMKNKHEWMKNKHEWKYEWIEKQTSIV